MDRFEDLVNGLVIAFGENTMNKSFMTGARAAMEAATQGGWKAQNWVKNTINAFTPYSGARRNIGGLVDPTRRRADSIGQYLRDQVVIWNQEAAPIIDVQGRTMDKKHLYIPWDWVNNKDSNALDFELLRVAKLTGRSGIAQVPSRMDGIQLSAEQQAKWAEVSRSKIVLGGKKFTEAAMEMIGSEMYKNAYVDDQIKMLRSVSDMYDKKAKKFIISEDPTLAQKLFIHKNQTAVNRKAAATGEDPSDLMERLLEKANL
jgi:hypothetical protein